MLYQISSILLTLVFSFIIFYVTTDKRIHSSFKIFIAVTYGGMLVMSIIGIVKAFGGV